MQFGVKENSFLLLIFVLSGCQSTLLKLYYPECVQVVKSEKIIKTPYFSTDKRNNIIKYNYAPQIHSKYQRYYLKIKGTWVSLLIQKTKKDKVFRSKIILMMKGALKLYEPKLIYLDAARHFVRHISNILGKRYNKPVFLTAAYEIMKKESAGRLHWELSRFQVLTTIEDCRKHRMSNMVLVYNTDVSRGRAISLSGGLSANGDGITHTEHKIATRGLFDLFYPATRIVFNWNMIIYFNSSSSYIHERQVDESLRPKYSRCNFSFINGGQQCESHF